MRRQALFLALLPVLLTASGASAKVFKLFPDDLPISTGDASSFSTAPLPDPLPKKSLFRDPEVYLHLDTDDTSAGLGYRFHPAHGLDVTTIVKGGALVPTGRTGTPYSTLDTSPYGEGILRLQYSGPVEVLGLGTAGYTRLRSHKGFLDPDGAAASPASSLPAQKNFSQEWVTDSGYLDAGKVASFGRNVKAAFFLAVDGFGFTALTKPSNYSDGIGEGNVGTLWMYKKGRNEVTLIGDLQLQTAMKDMFQNGNYTVVPSGLASAEYARNIGTKRLAAGVEGTAGRPDLAIRPYASIEGDRLGALISGNFRKSQDAFYPDVTGVGAGVHASPTPGVDVAVYGSYNRKNFFLAPAAQNEYNVMGMVTVDADTLVHYVNGHHSRGPIIARPTRDIPADVADLNTVIPSPGYQKLFDAAFKEAESFQKFVDRIPARGTTDILSALSAFTAHFSAHDYNYTEGDPPNLDNVEDIYSKARQSWLAGKDDAILVCIGSSQFAAVLARELGEKAGVPIAATASLVLVPDGTGAMAGHSIALVTTKEYGIVTVDWGKVMPTYSRDPKQALAIYQAAQGIPEIMHAITAGRDGHLVGYLYSEDGKTIVRNLTFHEYAPLGPLPKIFDDDPKGYEITLQHFRNVVRGKFD